MPRNRQASVDLTAVCMSVTGSVLSRAGVPLTLAKQRVARWLLPLAHV